MGYNAWVYRYIIQLVRNTLQAMPGDAGTQKLRRVNKLRYYPMIMVSELMQTRRGERN
jgi:hypothetical protein